MIIKCFCGCGNSFEEFDKRGRPRKFISGHNTKMSNPHKSNPELKMKYICKYCKKEFWDYKRYKRIYCSKKCWARDCGPLGGAVTKKSIRRTKPPMHSKENHWNWKGGITPESKLKRTSGEYKKWRTEVYKKNFFTCKICGKKSKNLHAHHIKEASIYPELFLDINNGETLCKQCHFKLHFPQKIPFYVLVP